MLRLANLRTRALGSAAAVLVLCAGVAGCGTTDASTSAALAPKVVKKGTLTVCTSPPYEPFEFKKGGKIVGFDIDLADQVAEKLKLKTTVVNTDFDAIQSGAALNRNKCDVAIAGLTITGERARVLDFSSPYFNAAQALVVKGTSGTKSLAGLGGKKIAVQKGTTGELYVTDNAPSTAKVVPYATTSDMDAAIRNGQVSAGVYDNTVVGDVVSSNPGFDVVGEFNTGEQYGMVVKKNSNIDLLRTINDVLADLKADGGYETIYKKWFGSAPKA